MTKSAILRRNEKKDDARAHNLRSKKNAALDGAGVVGAIHLMVN